MIRSHAEKFRPHEIVEDSPADGVIKSRQPRNLRGRQPHPGHLEEIVADSLTGLLIEGEGHRVTSLREGYHPPLNLRVLGRCQWFMTSAPGRSTVAPATPLGQEISYFDRQQTGDAGLQ